MLCRHSFLVNQEIFNDVSQMQDRESNNRTAISQNDLRCPDEDLRLCRVYFREETIAAARGLCYSPLTSGKGP